jgi:BspA type Leucine rich repeat region (6 copies)
MQHIRGSLEKWRKDNPNAKSVNISSRTDITDADFEHLEGIEELYMINCKKITDAAFKHLKSVKRLKMSYCNQEEITDKAFENLEKIEDLEIESCNQPGITDKAFKYFKRLPTLNMLGCNQTTITDKAFRYLENIQTLNMAGCTQFTDKAFTYLTGIRNLDMSYCNQDSITGATLYKLITPESAAKYLEKNDKNYLNLQVLTLYRCNEKTIDTAWDLFGVGKMDTSWDGKDIYNIVIQYNPPVKEGEKWKGFSSDDIEKLNTIFQDDGTSINYSVCPICLEYTERSEACMYMSHRCDENKVHTLLYRKYRNDEGYISWCTICNRIALGHRHYQRVPYDSVKKAHLEPIQDGGPLGVFDTDCTRQGGGGLDEKRSKFRSLYRYALKLEDEVGKISEEQARNELIQEVWNSPFSGTGSEATTTLKTSANERFTPSKFKHKNSEKNKKSKIPAFEDSGNEQPTINEHGRNNVSEEDNVKVIVFDHKQRIKGVKEHGITPDDLVSFIAGRVENRGDKDFGLCFMTPKCSAKLYPEELKSLDGFPKELYEKYNEYFNEKFSILPRQSGGNRRNFFKDADAVCALPQKGHSGTRSRTRSRRGGNRQNTRRKTPQKK